MDNSQQSIGPGYAPLHFTRPRGTLLYLYTKLYCKFNNLLLIIFFKEEQSKQTSNHVKKVVLIHLRSVKHTKSKALDFKTLQDGCKQSKIRCHLLLETTRTYNHSRTSDSHHTTLTLSHIVTCIKKLTKKKVIHKYKILMKLTLQLTPYIYKLISKINPTFTDYIGSIKYVTELRQSIKPSKETTTWRDIAIQNLEYVYSNFNYPLSFVVL